MYFGTTQNNSGTKSGFVTTSISTEMYNINILDWKSWNLHSLHSPWSLYQKNLLQTFHLVSVLHHQVGLHHHTVCRDTKVATNISGCYCRVVPSSFFSLQSAECSKPWVLVGRNTEWRRSKRIQGIHWAVGHSTCPGARAACTDDSFCTNLVASHMH